MINLRADLSASDLKYESLVGTNACLTGEIKRWKDRSDAFLRGSDHGAEWLKIQSELQEAQDKSQELTNIINKMNAELSDVKVKSEQLERDLDLAKTQTIHDKAKHQQDMDMLRADRGKREEMLKTLVGEMRDVVTTCQKELQLKDVDWQAIKGPMGPMADKLKNIKDEFAAIKKSLVEKIKSDREELKGRVKLAEDGQGEVQLIQRVCIIVA